VIGRVARLAVAATLAAGLVGAWRQRQEIGQVRAGLRPRFTTEAADAAPPAGPLGRRLATWLPDPPRSRPARLLAAGWAGPLTVLGLLLAFVGGRRPVWSSTHGCWVAAGIGGPSAVALRTVGADANAIGQVVLARSATPSPALLAHEAVHVRQAERLGPMLFPLYLWLGARYGYRHHPLERAARLGATRHVGP
jgi:hypothetical protein